MGREVWKDYTDTAEKSIVRRVFFVLVVIEKRHEAFIDILKLRFIGDFRMLIYAIVLIAVMLVSNNRALMERLHGLAGRFRKKGRAPSPAVASKDGGDLS